MATVKFIPLVFLLLAACGGGNNSTSNEASNAAATNHGYGFAFDAQGGNGMRLRYAGVVSADVAVYEKAFSEVEECTGIFAPSPFVVIVHEGALGSAPDDRIEGRRVSNIAGRYFSNPSLVLLDATVSQLRHEMVHYLLEFGKGDPDSVHASPLFARCAGG